MGSLTVPGTLDSLARIREFVDNAAASAELDRKAAYRLRLAVDEIATNIVNYGYGGSQTSGEIVIEAVTDDDWLTVTLEDSAPHFDPTAAEPPDSLEEPLEERPIGGLGIFLTVTGIDDFRYERRDGRNRNVFAMRRSGGATESEP